MNLLCKIGLHNWIYSPISRDTGSMMGCRERKCIRCQRCESRLLTVAGHFPWKQQEQTGMIVPEWEFVPQEGQK